MYYDCLQCNDYCHHHNYSSSMLQNNAKNIYNKRIINNNYDNGRNNDYLNKRGINCGMTTVTNINPHFVLNNYQYSQHLSDSFYSDYDKINCEKNSIIGQGKTKSPMSQITSIRKRSSLARPVRIHDSSMHNNITRKLSDFSLDERYDERSSAGEPAYYTAGLPFDDHSGSESGWPIRLRLEEMLELTLSRGKKSKRMKTLKRKKVTLTSKHSHFKDTERLLKVLSINNVDQDCRYNVKRCSVM
ncbi:hypothetical protein PV327_004622 [Microctonus hyperodae]|uniref:Uncharacterized protein n=1 Tax=Microctonus hyperodae TaxID=165561 RepID=A0AA39FD29_MICHY|nr:hypothetical protein PV327_004622 [Microctonus hyperodae]